MKHSSDDSTTTWPQHSSFTAGGVFTEGKLSLTPAFEKGIFFTLAFKRESNLILLFK